MKNNYIKTTIVALLLSITYAYAQPAGGVDKVIVPSSQPQTYADITTAFNGWTFSIVPYFDGTNGGYNIRRSKDNGNTWTSIDSVGLSNGFYPSLDIIVTGTDTNNLALFVSGVRFQTGYIIYIDKYNATTGEFITAVYSKDNGLNRVYDVALASDYQFPALGASPYSVALAYTSFSSVKDSLNTVVSLDGGNTFNIKNNVASTPRFFRNVSIAYGRSTSASNGRYFVAWDQYQNESDRLGHIYFSRNNSTVDGFFSAPKNLDSLSTTCINLCNDPSIAVSITENDNDSASCTAIVTFNRAFNGNQADYDMLCFVNERAHFASNWFRGDIDNDDESNKNADIFFDTQTNNFFGTYVDSTNSSLAIFKADWNAILFNSVTTKYNDAPLVWGTNQVQPKLSKSIAKTYPECVWASNSIGFYNAQQIQLAISSTSSSPTITPTIPLTFTFSEGVTNFDLSDITVTGGSLSNFAGTSTIYTAILTATGGIATVSVANDVATANNAAATFSIDYQPSGISLANAENVFMLYPNPTNGNATIFNPTNQAISVAVYNALGALVYKTESTTANTTLPLATQAAGVYNVVITTPTQRLSGKVVKE